MRMSRGATAAIGAAALAAGMVQAAPAQATAPSAAGGTGWHWVDEGWQPYVQTDYTYPAARYCGSFDLRTTVVTQDIRSKVLSRWDNGTAKDTFYSGPLTIKATNATSGESQDYDMGGDAIESDNSSGAMQTYQMIGPVGMGMPIGTSKGLPAGVYVLNGYHLVRFDADGTRTLEVALGSETNICTALG